MQVSVGSLRGSQPHSGCNALDRKNRLFAQARVKGASFPGRVELKPIALRTADRELAGIVQDSYGKPARGHQVTVPGDDQPGVGMETDAQGRFHFQVCDGKILLQIIVEDRWFGVEVKGGQTNLVVTIHPKRPALVKQPLPDLRAVGLPAGAAPSGAPVLLCLFDVSQPGSKQVLQELDRQSVPLLQFKIKTMGVQAAAISDDDFNAWKKESAPKFQIGRVARNSPDNTWATDVNLFPWFILADGNRRVVSEGFLLDNLNDEIKKLNLPSSGKLR